jgi:hypothetical protein
MWIQHDPMYVGYILNNSETARANRELFPTSWIIAAVVIVAVVCTAFIVYFKKRNH